MVDVTGSNTAASSSGDRAQKAAASRIAGFAKRYGEAHCNLARHAAFALALTPDLLYQIWANFVPETPWIAVSHILLSRLCRSVGYELYEMDIAVRNQLLAELKEQYGQKRFNDLAEFLQDYVVQQLTDDDPNTQELAQAQEWTALAYTKPGQLARELAEALSAQAKTDLSEVFRLTSLTEILAEPLIEAGFEPLLIYGNGLKNYARGDQEGAIADFARLPGGWQRAKTAGVGLVIPDQMKSILETQATVQEHEIPKFYALLIGIDYYLPNELYKNVRGSVRDIDLVESFLKQSIGISSDYIFKLTASNPDDSLLLESPEQLATKKNIVEAFRRLAEVVQPGDQIYIHCSGQGGRVETIYPELKGATAFDSALVPTDVAISGYLRDVEFESLIEKILEKEADVTAILDICHAGGMIGANRASTNSFQHYILLAACRPTEYCYEYAVNGKDRHGAFTYWFIDTLITLGANITYQWLYNRIFAKIQSKFPNQTPQLYGDGNRIVFKHDRLATNAAVTVIKVTDQQIILNAGLAQGLSTGARFAIYPLNSTTFSDQQKQLALVEVTEVEASSAVCKMLTPREALSKRYAELAIEYTTVNQELGYLSGSEESRKEREAEGILQQMREVDAKLKETDGIEVKGQIEQGAPAVMISATADLVRRVRLFNQKQAGEAENNLPIALVDRQEAALNTVRQALAGNGWVVEVQGSKEAHYQVEVGRNGTYEISIGISIENLGAPLAIDDPDSAATVVNRLVHLAKYQAVQELDNDTSELTQAIEFEPLDQNKKPFLDPINLTLKHGDLFHLRVKNVAPRPLNIAILDLEPTWAISRILLGGIDTSFYQLEPNETIDTQLRLEVPEGQWYESCRETFKLYAARGPIDFRWLELPPLDQPQITHRAATIVFDPKADWATKQISIHVRRL